MKLKRKNTIYYILTLAIIAVVVSFFAIVQPPQKSIRQGAITYELEGKKYNLLVADSEKEWSQGLMYYRSHQGFDGMIFKFPYKNYQRFWNKNTFLDLEVYWIDGETVVGKSELPSIEKSEKLIYISSPKQVDTVIELIK